MSKHAKFIGDLVSNSSTQRTLHARLTAKIVNDPTFTDEDGTEAWIQWGRKILPQRLLNTACLVITNAMYGETTPFRLIQDQCVKGGSHNWMYHITDHFFDLCLENDWPFYGSMIVDKNGKTTTGFLKRYEKKVSVLPVDKDALLTVCQNDCMTGDPEETPSTVEICARVIEYVHSHNL